MVRHFRWTLAYGLACGASLRRSRLRRSGGGTMPYCSSQWVDSMADAIGVILYKKD